MVLICFLISLVARVVLLILSEQVSFPTTLLLSNSAPIQNSSCSHFPSDASSVHKILYVVTSSSMINSRKSRTDLFGPDRLTSIVIPVLSESIKSMTLAGFQVDLYLIVSYELTHNQLDGIKSVLPANVTVDVWNDATPIDYDDGYRDRPFPKSVTPIGRALARQHRYVVRDKLFDYDFFACFEDDMLVTGTHVQHYLYLSKWIDDLRAKAASVINLTSGQTVQSGRTYEPNGHRPVQLWFGNMSYSQFPRLRPGFIRVEVDVRETEGDTGVLSLPIDFNFSDVGYSALANQTFDPLICCPAIQYHPVKSTDTNSIAPSNRPNATQLIVWETSIDGIGVREMPDGTWVGLLSGPSGRLDPSFEEYAVGKLLASQARQLKIPHPGANPKLLAQSAGWMMTRKQILELHLDLCQGSFLPPYDQPVFAKDGLFLMNVEFWSGGIQMWCANRGCNIQRLILLDPKNFSKHLMYHTSNNKQTRLPRERRVPVLRLLGQLNTLRKDAIYAKHQGKKDKLTL